jgi:hypothetical protein
MLKSNLIIFVSLLCFNILNSQKILVYKDDIKKYLLFGNGNNFQEFRKINYNEIDTPDGLLDTLNSNLIDGDYVFINRFYSKKETNNIFDYISGTYKNNMKTGRFIYFKFNPNSNKKDTIYEEIRYCDYLNGVKNGVEARIIFVLLKKTQKKEKNLYYPVIAEYYEYEMGKKNGISIVNELGAYGNDNLLNINIYLNENGEVKETLLQKINTIINIR